MPVCILFQMLMNVPLTMVGVHITVEIQMDHLNAAVDLDSPWHQMGKHVMKTVRQ